MNDEMMKHKHLLFFLPTVLAILLSCPQHITGFLLMYFQYG